MFKVVHSEDSIQIVDSTAEAVELMFAFGSYVELINPLKKGYTEVERTIHSRVAAMDADDRWPGAKYEQDIVPRQWVHARGRVTPGRFNPTMSWPQKVRIDQVRA